jgi:ubiquinone/menaquinone biosynthesis C-methylase UbiE
MTNSVEQYIIQRFDEIADAVVSDSVSSDNFELVPILRFFGQPAADSHLLDVGSGQGKFVPELVKKGFNVIGVEPSSVLIESAKVSYPNTQFVQASATDLPFQDGVFDFVMCVETLEHIPNTEKAVSEMARVLKPGGKLIIIDKNINSLHPIHFAPTAIWKKALEGADRWMYPRSFPFREKYFVPRHLRKIVQQYFSSAEVEFLRFWPERRRRSLPKRLLWGIHRGVSTFIQRIIPSLSFYVAWKAIK